MMMIEVEFQHKGEYDLTTYDTSKDGPLLVSHKAGGQSVAHGVRLLPPSRSNVIVATHDWPDEVPEYEYQ